MNDMSPSIDKGKRFSVIWIIPIVALFIGLWMVVQTKLAEGPTITVSFESAEGLEAGKTKIEYLNVTMGLVQEISLSKDLNGVVATIELDPEAEDMLRDDTRFWVVRARIGAGSISGLGTLLSGAYIEIAPGEREKGKRHFQGLEIPPLTPLGAPGVKLTLFSEQAGSVSTGDAILYNGYKVGRIEGVNFDSERIQIRYDAFIDAPFDKLVTTTVRFWNTSGINMKVSAEGLDVRTGSLDTILLGGVAFSVPEGFSEGEPVENGTEFQLFRNYSDMQKEPYRQHIYYVVAFDQSLRGLLPGAPVEYRGIQIGSVVRIMAKELMVKNVSEGGSKAGAGIPVLISIEPGRLDLPDTHIAVENMKETIASGVSSGGLRGTLQTGNLLTGSLYVNFDYYKDVDKAVMGEWEGYTTIPTIPSGLGRIEQQVSSFLDKLNALPLQDTVTSMDGTLASLTKTLNSIDAMLNQPATQELTAELGSTMVELRKILSELAPEGSAYQSLNSSINELNNTLYNLEELTRTLAVKPNALLLPTDFPADPQPEANKQ